MATKKDLQQAQSYSRQRVLTAFVSGIPGGKELEPTNPMRAVVAAVALAVLLVVGSLIFGLMRPGLPTGWDDNRLVLSQDTGARYISQKGVLYPVLNTTSARLVIPAKDFKVITIDESRLSDVKRGATIGILGAPDELPTTTRLVQSGWASCVVGVDQLTIVTKKRSTSNVSGATVVQLDGVNYVVSGSLSYQVEAAHNDALLRSTGVDSVKPVVVTAQWLNLFEHGTAIAPITIAGAGEPIAATTDSGSLLVGQVVHAEGSPDDKRYVITADSTLAELTPFAYQLYLLGTGATLGAAVDVSSAVLGSIPTAAKPLVAADWPTSNPRATDLTTQGACATLDTTGDAPVVSLSEPLDSAELAASPSVIIMSPTGGAIVRAIATGEPGAGQVYLIDGSGTAYPVPDASKEVIAQLGFTAAKVAKVPESWVNLFLAGPALTVEAAGSPPVTAETTQDAPVATGPSVSVDGSTNDGIAPSSSLSADAGAACTVGDVQLSTEAPPALALLQDAASHTRATGSGVIVAVVDSGVDAGNPHLGAVVLPGVNLVPDGAAADGRSDAAGHGTAIAGEIAAQPIAGSGVVGFAPGATILPVRVFRGSDEESVKAGFGPDTARLAQGIRYAADHGARIINVSLSDTSDSAELHGAVSYAASLGSLVVASAGNRGTASDVSDGVRYPAGYPEALGVGAVGEGNIVSAASINGPQVDVTAPGTNVLTSATGAGDCLYASTDASTSFATGYASAAAALVAEAFPTATPAEWRYRLMVTASRAGPDHRDDANGWGFIQPYEALTTVLDGTLRGPDNPTAARVSAEAPHFEPVVRSESLTPLAPAQAIVLVTGVIGGTALLLVALIARLRRAQASGAATK